MCLKNEAVSLSSVQIWRAFVFKAMSFSVESISLIACHLWALSGGQGHLARHFFPEHKHLIFLPLSCLQPLDSNLPYFIQWKWDREGLFWVQTLLSGWHFSYRLQYCLVFFSGEVRELDMLSRGRSITQHWQHAAVAQGQLFSITYSWLEIVVSALQPSVRSAVLARAKWIFPLNPNSKVLFKKTNKHTKKQTKTLREWIWVEIH